MKDRVVQYPNRYKLTPVSGDIYDLTPEPGIVNEEGTDLNKANLLSDATAAALGLGGDPSVNDALFVLSDMTVEFITSSKTWVAPADLKGDVHAMLFGGGGGVYWVSSSDYSSGGAGSGYLTEGDVSLTPGQGYSAVIGSGGVTGASPGRGGTTSFAGLSAEGGYPGQKYISGSGGNPSTGGRGGDGGAGGSSYYTGSTSSSINGGNGQYGGGGGGYDAGGNGGTYGGGGSGSTGGTGGTYGGAGSSGTAFPAEGAYFYPTSKWHRLLINFFGKGSLPAIRRNMTLYGGGGGAGSLGGLTTDQRVKCGGGGFFAEGGTGTYDISNGGGGGFFGKGGVSNSKGAGGGGGFFAEGGSGLLSAGANANKDTAGVAGAGVIVLFYQTEG